MEYRAKAQVLSASYAYFRILQVYNIDNSRNKPKLILVRRISLAFCVTVLVMTAPIVICLGVWHMIESTLDIGEFSTSFALMLAYVLYKCYSAQSQYW